MPIVITFPTPGAQFGPGTLVNVSSDFIWGDHPDARWQVGIISEDGQFVVERQAFFPVSPFAYQFLTNNRSTSITQQSAVPWPVADTPVTISVEISDPTQIYETATTQARWNPTFQLGLQQYLQTTQVTGGFTAQDRVNLQLAVDNTTVDMLDTTIPPDLHNVPVGRLPNGPPIPWGERVGPFNLTGRGVLDLVGSGVRGIWLGMRWFYEVIPPGWGMTPGSIDEFDNRPAQLVVIQSLNSGEQIGSPILDTNTSGGYQELNPAHFQGQIGYTVAPGWRVSLFMYKIIGS